MITKHYTPADWYWFVGGDTTHVYSSATDTTVPATDDAYLAWVASGGITTPIDTLSNLMDVLEAAGVSAYDRLIAGGLTLTSATTPAVDGVYALDAATQTNITTVASYINAYGEFPSGQTINFPWPLQTGATVLWPTTAAFTAFAKSVGQVVALAKLAPALGQPMPSTTVAIP
jgi:hypothetical protein